MQQTFQCLKCGAQNYVGQPVCWNCQSQFQYNCPNCKVAVQNTMGSCPNCHIALTWSLNQSKQPQNQPQQQYSQLFGFKQRGQPLLLFLAPVLADLLLGYQTLPSLPEINPIPDAINTPMGVHKYPGINKLAFISIPHIDQIGGVGRTQVRTIYLDITIDNMAKQLRLDSTNFIKSLLDFSRIIIVGALVTDKPLLLYKSPVDQGYIAPWPQIRPDLRTGSGYLPDTTDNEYCPYYSYTETNMDSIGIIKELQSNVIYCLNNHLNTLPSTVVDSWIKTTLNPIFAKLKSKMDCSRQQKTYQPTSYNPKDRLYLTTITIENDPNKNTNIVFCDAKGHLSNSHLDKLIVDTAYQIIAYYREHNKYCAVACFEITEGKSRTFGVEIDYQEGLALEGIMTTLRNNKISSEMIPENFQKYISQIFTKAYAELKYRQSDS